MCQHNANNILPSSFDFDIFFKTTQHSWLWYKAARIK